MDSLKVLLLVAALAGCNNAANILVINPFTSKSHYIAIRPIGLELARRGHNVTIITAFREPNPPANYHEVMVDMKPIWELMGVERPNIFSLIDKSSEEFMKFVMWNGGYGFTESALNSTPVREFMNNDNKFDLVVSEQFFQEAFNILAYKYRVPLVLVGTVGNCMKHNIVTGNPLQLNTVIYEYLPWRDVSSIWGRLRNIYAALYEYVWWKHWYLVKQDGLVRKYVPGLEEPVPSVFEMQKNASLLFINSHFSVDTPMALLPNIVEIGGMHLSRSDESLPKDLQDIIDKSKHGVVYMNFGSNVRISDMDENKKKAFINVFRNLKQTVLLKWEEDELENKPDNVVIRKWYPQKEIFAHPNIKLFISHGGLIGTQEATFNAIPMIGVPVYADQFNNMEQVERIGCGKVLEYHDINEVTLGKAVNEILNNNKYKLKAEEVAQRFKDRPMTPLDTVMWWIEYVIRHKGAEFMKSPAREISWFKYYMIDIYIILLVSIIAIISLVLIAVSTLKQLLGGKIKSKHD